MNIINKLTLRHLKSNKGRTVVTTLGICVSVAMITAVFIALASFLNLFGEIELFCTGNYQAKFFVNEAQLELLRNDDKINEIGLMTEGKNASFQLAERKSDHAGTGDIVYGDKTFITQTVTGTYDGVLPQRVNEIAVEESLISKNGLDWKIGDTVSIPVGTRYFTEQGMTYPTTASYHVGETFEGEAKEFKITAILHDNPATNAFQNIIACSNTGNDAFENGNSVYACISLKKIDRNSLKVIKQMTEDYEIESYDINTDYLNAHLAFDGNNSSIKSMFAFAAIILAVIIAASVVLIYNAFAMSISERIRYLGMLASVGATKKQKRLSVYFESFILGIIGIPVGMAAGISGIGITLKFIGKKIISTGMILGVNSDNMDMKVVIPVWVIIGIILISIFTIFISSFIPSMKASKITPIDAIKQTNEVKVKANKLHSSKLIRKIFGYEGEIANKNLKRNSKKSNVITASIALSVILFLACNYFCSLFTRSVDLENDIPYQVTIGVSDDRKDELSEHIKEINNIDDFYCVNNGYAQIDNEYASEYEIGKPENLTLTYKDLFSKGIMIFFNFIDDERFDELCKSNGLNKDEYYSGEPKALLMNNVSHKQGGANVFTEKIIGSSFEDLSAPLLENMTVGALIKFDESCKSCLLNPKNTISVYVPLSVYVDAGEKYCAANNEDFTYNHMIGIETKKHTEVTDDLHELANSLGLTGTYIQDITESVSMMTTVSFVIQVFVYGFIILISLITVFNIINTISTGVAMRKKEFAMLKSVGMTPKGFNKMIMLESAFYGIKAIIFALPISVALSYAMYVALETSGSIPFSINWLLYLIVTAVVLAIIGITMIYSVHKLKNDSIVETLKQEIN